MKILLGCASLGLLLLLGCQAPNKSGNTVSDNTVHQPLTSLGNTSGTMKWATSPAINLSAVRTVDLDLLLSPGLRVSYLLTNVSATSQAASDLSVLDPDRVPRTLFEADEPVKPTLYTRLEIPHNIPSLRKANARSLTQPSFDTTPAIGDGGTFADAYSATSIPVHIRGSSTVSAVHRTVYVWVSDDAWDAAGDGNIDLTDPGEGLSWHPPAHPVSQAMVDALAAKFLSDGSDDVYGWVTAIFGREWADAGTPSPADLGGTTLIDGHGNIHIFVVNLNPAGTTNGILMGYFYALNNFVGVDDGDVSSNEKILFALDADSLGNPDDDGRPLTTGDAGNWSISDYWPAEIVSTLAHEFQHMIQFYQKQVLNDLDVDTESWVNEMSSMVAEDLVADKLGVLGPRGRLGMSIAGDELEGRLPMFNYYHAKKALTAWSQSNPLPNYSQAYAFGAWLLRSYGGPALFRSLVQNSRTNYRAIVDAVNDASLGNGTSHTFASLVLEWGLATFLNTSTLSPFRYRNANSDDGSFSWDLDGETYHVGGIDLGTYNQIYQSGSQWINGDLGPAIRSGALSTADKVYPGGTFFYDAGTVPSSGHWQKSLVLPVNVQLTVVVNSGN